MPPRNPAATETAMLRVAALAISLTWPLWVFEAYNRKFPATTGLDDWYPLTSVCLFALGNLFLIAACISGHRRLLVLALRTASATLPVALLLLICSSLSGSQEAASGIWFTVLVSIPALAFALTVPLRFGLPPFTIAVGGVTLANALLDHPTDTLSIATEVTFSLVYSLPLALIACATLQLARFIDSAENEAHRDNIAATRLRARAEETTRLTALVHDNVLSTLSGITRGILPSEPVDLRLTTVFDDVGTMSSPQLIAAVTAAVGQHTPDCTVTADSPTDLTLPGVAGANIALAIAEVAKNSRQHAGPDVHRSCHISLSDTAVQLRYADDGTGFRTGDIRPTAAGLRVSVLGRMSTTDGAAATVTSSPRSGTTVDITWQHTTSPTQSISDDHSTTARRSWLNSSGMQTYDLMHLSYAICVPYGITVALLFTCMNILNGNPSAPGNIVANTLTVMLAGVLVSGHAYRLTVMRAGVAAVGIVVLMEVGRWQNLSDAPGWSYGWHIMAASLLCALVALRGRPTIAVAALLTGAVVVEIAMSIPATPDLDFGAFRTLMSSLLVVSCALVSFGIRNTLTRLPDARQKLHDAELRTIAAAEISEYRQDRLQRLREELAPVVAATTGLADVTDELREQAHLTELRLRDAMRSPLLDIPAVHAAARSARRRGVVVQLLDDNSPAVSTSVGGAGSPGDVPPPGEEIHPELHQRIITALSSRSTETVTVRLHPPGRATFCTISTDDGLRRYRQDGTPV
ncbi:hypothetical protein [Corynebacterium sp.]|uniref:hypothetical protein n=1 Tax=Corynebacterium sp. TaxID=1720 RepID=UPI003B3A85F0